MPQPKPALYVGVSSAYDNREGRLQAVHATPAIPRHACAGARVPQDTLAVQGRALREECMR